MPSDNIYHLTWVSLTLDEGFLLTAAPPDLECGVAPLGSPVPMQQPILEVGLLLSAVAPNLGCREAPLSRHPWPQMWGSSSRTLLHCHSLVLSVTTPTLGKGYLLTAMLLCSQNMEWSGKEVQEGGNISIHIADSLHCTAETNRSNYPPTKNNFF